MVLAAPELELEVSTAEEPDELVEVGAADELEEVEVVSGAAV